MAIRCTTTTATDTTGLLKQAVEDAGITGAGKQTEGGAAEPDDQSASQPYLGKHPARPGFTSANLTSSPPSFRSS